MAQAKMTDYARFDHALLISLSNGLGTWLRTGDVDSEGREVKGTFYQKDQDCLGCLKDLQRFLRKDDPDTRDVFFKLGAFETARKDLVPLLIHYPQDHAIVYNSLKVLTFLTMPVNTTSARPQEQQQLIDKVKEAFLLHPHEGAMTVVADVAAAALSRHPRMSEEQACSVQLVLTFLRNLLYVPEVQVNRSEWRSNYLQEALYKNLFESDVMELLMVVSQHAGERPFKSEMALLLDIFHQIYRGTEPEALMQAEAPPPPKPVAAHGSAAAREPQQRQQGRQTQQGRRQQPKQGPQAEDGIAGEMLKILAMEKARKAAALAGAPRWHSRNPARFVRQHAEHSRPVFLAKPQVSELPELHVHVPATKAIAVDGAEVAPGSSQLGPALMWRLRQWTDELCNGDGYNALMKVLMKEAEPGIGISRLAAPDFARLMRVARFFTAYARVKQEARQQKQQQQQQQQKQQQGQEAHQSRLPQQHAAADAGSDAEPSAAAQKKKEGAQAEEGARQDQQQQQEQGTQDAAAQEKQQQEAAEEAEAASPFACIASTMGWNTFYLVLTSWLGQVDVPAKSDLKDWELQHASLSLLREMLAVLELAERVGNMPDRRAADKLQRRLLHDDMKESGLLCVLSRLMRSFNAKLQPRAHAVDIIQSMHTVLKMYDRLCAAEGGGFVVRRKAHAGGGGRRKPRLTQNAEEDGGGTPGPPDVDGDGGGAESSQQQGNAEAGNEANPEGGDASNGADGEEREGPRQQAQGSPAASASRNDGGRGGGQGIGEGRHPSQPRRDPMEELEEDEEWDEGGDSEQRSRRVKEAVLDLNRRLRQELATPATIHFYTTQGLVFYAHNSPATNAAITALLERISSPNALDLEPMLYQLSVLRVMHKILSDRTIRSKAKLPAYQGLLRLCTRVVRGLMAKLVPDLESEDVVPDGGKNAKAASGGDRDGRPAEGGAPSGAEKQNGGGESDSLEIEEEGGEGAGGEGVESKSNEERRRAVAFENKVKSGISSMLFIDLMFWKTAMVAEEINNDYFMRLDQVPAYDPRKEASKAADKGGMTAGAGRSLQAWDEEEEQEGMAGVNMHTGAGDDAHKHGSSGDEGNVGEGACRQAGMVGRAGDGGHGETARERQQAAGTAKRLHAMDAETLMQRREMLRKAHFKQSKRTAAGGGGASSKPQLSSEQVAKLVGLFERYNAHKANMDTIVEAMGEGFSKGQAAHELRALGLKFGQLTPTQLATLRTLYGRYRLERDMSTLIAAELSGGWTSRQITSLLKKHRLTEEDEEEGAEDEDGGDEEPIDNDALAEAFMLHKGREDVLAKVVEELGGQVSQRAVLRRLRKLKLVRGSASSSRKARGGGSRSGRVDVAQLRELYEQFKDKSDMLNQIAAHLPGDFSAKQVQRLLKKHEVVVDEGMVRKRARQAEERTRLTAAYQRHRLKPQYLEAIAEDMPGIVTVQQVLRMLRKHGLVDGGVKRASRQLREVSPIGSDEGEAGGTQRARKQRAGIEEAANDGSRRHVPQPDPARVLQALKAMEHAHDGRWMEPQTAVAWVKAKLSAAEALWAETQPPHVDYALVMEAEEDEAFFMTDYSQELLEAAGIRNDAGDYYKIPGNSTPAWRASMRSALEGALQNLDTPEADALYVQLRRREAEQAEQAAAKAAAAEVEAARVRAMGGFGDSKAAQGKGRKTGGRLTKKQQQQQEQLRQLDRQLSDDDDAGGGSSASAGSGGEGPDTSARPAAKAAGLSSGAIKKAVTRAGGPREGGSRGGAGGGSDLESSSDSGDSSGSSSDSSASSGLGASDVEDEEARALPHYSESDAEEEEQQDRKQQPSTKNKRSAGLALHSSGSNGEGDVEPGGAAGKKVRPSPGTTTTTTTVAKAPGATRPSSSSFKAGSTVAAQHGKGEASASAAEKRGEGQEQGGKVSRHERVLWGGGSKADARKAALAALAAKRGTGASQAAGATPAHAKQHSISDGDGGSPLAGGAQGLPPSRLPAAGAKGPRERSLNQAVGHEDDEEGGAAGGGSSGRGGKKRRLMRQGGKENSEAGGKAVAPPVGNTGAGGEVLEDVLEDF